MTDAFLPTGQVWQLPPLILHPFADPAGPDKLVESSRAHLMLQGLLPSGGLSTEEIEAKLVEGRFCEVRMLFYVGRDLTRWVEQCLESADRDEALRAAGLRFGSFANLLIEGAPPLVREKLQKWGVVDYKAIFARAFGLNAVFHEMPARDALSAQFLKNYYRFIDQLFQVRMGLEPFPRLNPKQFSFDLFASGEYSRMLEREWEEGL